MQLRFKILLALLTPIITILLTIAFDLFDRFTALSPAIQSFQNYQLMEVYIQKLKVSIYSSQYNIQLQQKLQTNSFHYHTYSTGQLLKIAAYLNHHKIKAVNTFNQTNQNHTQYIFQNSQVNTQAIQKSSSFQNTLNYGQFIHQINKYHSNYLIFQCPLFTVGIKGEQEQVFDNKIKEITNSCWSNETEKCNLYNQSFITPLINEKQLNLLLGSDDCILHSMLDWNSLKRFVVNNSILFQDQVWFFDENITNQTKPFKTNFTSKFKTNYSLLSQIYLSDLIRYYPINDSEFSVIFNSKYNNESNNPNHTYLLLTQFQENYIATHTKINYGQVTIAFLSLIPFLFVFICNFSLQLIFQVSFIYIWRKTITAGLSLEMPIRTLIDIMNVDIDNLEKEEYAVTNYYEYFNSDEINKLYITMIHFVNNIKYSNNKLWEMEFNEAITLISQSKSKQFYQEYENLTAVGICANNIARMHMRNKRFLEAMNEQEESLMIANYEIEELKSYKRLILQLSSRDNLFQTLQKFRNQITLRFKMLDGQWLQKLNKKQLKDKPKIKQKDSFDQRVNIMEQNQNPKISNKQLVDSVRQDLSAKDSIDQNQSRFPMMMSPQLDQSPNKSLNMEKNSLFAPNFQSHSNISNVNNDNEETKEKLKEIKQQKLIIKQKVLYRKYQLATIIFKYSLQRKSLFFKESISLFTQLQSESELFEPKSNSIYTMQVNLNTKKAICQIIRGDIIEAKITLKRAQNILDNLKLSINTKQSTQQENNYIDIFENIPFDILQEKIYNGYGLANIVEGNFIEACRTYVDILSTKTFFDPQLQIFAIKTLKSIFKHLDLPRDSIINFQKTLIQKDLDIIILIDYNHSMTPEQIILSHTLANMVLDNLLDDDSVALYAFNETLYEVFPMQKKGTYKNLLEQMLKQLLIYPGGSSKLFDIILTTALYLFDMKQTAFQKRLMKYVQFNQLKGNQKADSKLQIEEVKKLQKEYPMSNDYKRKMFKQISNSSSSLRLTNILQESEIKKIKNQGDQNEECIDEILEIRQNKIQKEEFGENIDAENIKEEEEDTQKEKFIFLFSDGVSKFDNLKFQKIKTVLTKKKIDLLIFNVPNQNANTLYLKLLSESTPSSQFFTSEKEMIKFFQEMRHKQYQKRQYLEFF